MNILIIGASGFIGKSLLASLCDDSVNHYYLTTNSNTIDTNIPRNSTIINSIIKDLSSQLNQLKRIDCVINLSAISNPRSSIGREYEHIDNLVLPFFEILDIAKTKGLTKVIFASSRGALYPINNEILNNVDNAYAATKLATEIYLSSYALANKISCYSLRVSNPIGIQRKQSFGIIEVFTKKLLNNQDIELIGDYDRHKDYVCVTDVVNAFKAIIFSSDISQRNHVLDIGSGLSLNALDIKEIISNIIFKKKITPSLQKSTLDLITTYELIGWKPRINPFHAIENVVCKLQSDKN